MTGTEIPLGTVRRLLPQPEDSALKWLQYSLPPALGSVAISDPAKIFSTEPPNLVDSATLSSIMCPPKRIIDSLRSSLSQFSDIQSITCAYLSVTKQNERVPLFMLTYWFKLDNMRRTQQKLAVSFQTLEKFRSSPQTTPASRTLADDVRVMLGMLPWQDSIRGFPLEMDSSYLSAFFGTEWLSSEHINLMMHLLENDTQTKGLSAVEFITETANFTTRLKQAHLNPDEYDTDQGYRWLSKIGQRLANGHSDRLALVANTDQQNHWVAILIDVRERLIWFGNSLKGDGVPTSLMNALKWWLYYHFAEPFRTHDLPITIQRDGYNCGIFAWQALEAALLKKPLITTNEPYTTRLKLFKRVVSRHQDTVGK